MIDAKESDASAGRLRLFAELYSSMLAERPYMEMLARHNSMKKAELTIEERVTAERCLKTKRLGDLLVPKVVGD